ncbi:hypothetical protein ACFPAF_15795 [Hymenobacter endophyticus]|uniref:Uncharacterized protein n=1 Tax=Hymenobacter endophyticus TaxID=3076335 RepID=A0ABU3TKW9_9BACT|nr:hypothetical protein [Hymenobacter endophyticus]MDU0371865.1 hypothetical protein [Hymenobacter endophyticus]
MPQRAFRIPALTFLLLLFGLLLHAKAIPPATDALTARQQTINR